MIRHNENIKGITIENKEYCLLQYADDTVIFLDGSEKSLKSALDLLFQFAKYSGLKPNIDKTKAIWIGSKIDCDDTLCAEYDLCWSKGTFIILGIHFNCKLENMEQLNYNDKILGIEKELIIWSKRYLTTLGKIIVIKSLLLPKLTHLFIALPKPNDNTIYKIETIFYKFIWNKKPDRVARKTLIQDYSKGGLRMIHINTFIKSLKLTWIRRILNNQSHSKWADICLDTNKVDLKKLTSLGDRYVKLCSENTTNKFWKEIFEYLSEFQCILQHGSQSNILDYPLWMNSDIKIDGKDIFYRSWFEKGILTIRDMLNENGNIYTYEKFITNYNINVPFTVFLGLKVLLLNKWPVLRNVGDIKEIGPFRPRYIEILCKDNKGSRRLYDIFLEKITGNIKAEKKWESALNRNIDWGKVYRSLHKCTNDSKIIWFQYRILHRILATNNFLYKLKITNDVRCSFCNAETETMIHVFYDCYVIKDLWNRIENWLNLNTDRNFSISLHDVLFLKQEIRFSALNVCIILIKLYIYRKRFQNKIVNIEEVKQSLTSYYETEKFMYKIKDQGVQFKKRWNLLDHLFH